MRLLPWYIALVLACATKGGFCQSFSSGSTGADGPLTLTTPGTVLFDPKTFNPPLNPAGDNVFHFTTITIGQGVTLKLTSKILTGPVYFLATGAVQIDGTIDLNGETGHTATASPADRTPAPGGAGGFPGGVGGKVGTIFPPTAGNGPGGGLAATANSGGVLEIYGRGGQFSGSQYLIPLIGGSGGGGGANSYAHHLSGGGGGGGGGALMIASSVSITMSGQGLITAEGGAGGTDFCCSGTGGGSGGAIRLIAPAIAGSHVFLSVRGGPGANPSGAGLIRLEASLFNWSGANFSGPSVTSPPFKPALPTTPPAGLRVISINGTPINANPFTFPDITINAATGVVVNIQGQYIPIGTVPKVHVYSESGQQVVDASPLQGTFQNSTSTATITYPTGGSRGLVKAVWTQ